MIEVEEQLRHEMRTAAERVLPESIRPLRVPRPRRWRGSARWLAPVAAAAAVAAVIVGVTVTGQRAGHQPVSQLASGMPKYYVTLNDVPRAGTPRYVLSAVVRATTTGAPIDSVQLVRSRIARPDVGVAAASNDRAFLIVLPKSLEILRIASDGHVLRLARLPQKVFNLGTTSPLIAVLSPNGTEILMQVGCNLGLVSVRTGAVTRTWLSPRHDKGCLAEPINWPGTGQDALLQLGSPFNYRVLNVARTGGSLLADSRQARTLKNPRGWWNWGYELLPDDKTLITGFTRSTRNTATARILEISASSGRLRRVLHVFSHVPNPGGAPTVCGPGMLGPSGVHALTWCINRLGRLDGSHFTPLPGPPGQSSGVGAAW